MIGMLWTGWLGDAHVAQAAAGGAGMGELTGALVPMLLMFAVMYFLLIRPASKQRKDHAALLNGLKKGDEVVTTGGLYGRIVGIEDTVAVVEIADRVKVKVLRDRISGKWPSQAKKSSTGAKAGGKMAKAVKSAG